MSNETYTTIDKLVRKWSCLAKFAGCDASRAKDQQSARVASIALYGEKRQAKPEAAPCTSGISPCTGARPLGRRIFGRVFANSNVLEILKRQLSVVEEDEHIVH